MDLIELYNNCKNPIDDNETIRKLIIAYSKTYENNNGFYSQLIRTRNKPYTGISTEYQDKLYAMLFNKWKKSLVDLSVNEYRELERKGYFDSDYIKLRNFLISIPDVKTKKEADNIFNTKYRDIELTNAMSKYKWSSLGNYSRWNHVCSKYLTAHKDNYPHIDHRLYLSFKSEDTHEMLYRFIEKCQKYNLPYYFKFDEYSTRDDNIVIYSSTQTILSYIQVLKEIKKEYPKLVARAENPPIITGKIDSWIGYGSEPMITPDGKNHSFNEIRSYSIESAIEQSLKKWILNNRNKIINYNNKYITIEDYIAIRSSEYLLENMKQKYIYQTEEEKQLCKRFNKIYDEKVVRQRLGYALSETTSSLVQGNIQKYIFSKLPQRLDNLISKNFGNLEPIKMQLRYNKELIFNGVDLKVILQKMSPEISKYDPNFIIEIKKQLKDNAQEYGIDPNNYCFDLHTKQKIQQIDSRIKKQRYEQLKREKEYINKQINNHNNQLTI